MQFTAFIASLVSSPRFPYLSFLTAVNPKCLFKNRYRLRNGYVLLRLF